MTEPTSLGFTDGVVSALASARDIASNAESDEVTARHILLGVLANPENSAHALLEGMGVSPEALLGALSPTSAPGRAAGTPREMPVAPSGVATLEGAMREARDLRSTAVATRHLLVAAITNGVTGELGTDALDHNRLREALRAWGA